MAIYLMPKTNRLIQKAANFRPLPKQWTPKWTIVKRPFSRQPQTNCSVKNSSTGPKQQQNQQQQQQNQQFNQTKIGEGEKGNELKKIKQKWRWGAAYWTILTVLDWWVLAAGGWLTWRGVFMRWTPIGLCVFAATNWHLHNKELDRQGLPRTASQWQMNIYCSLPLRLMSRCWGWLADCQVPKPVRPVLYGLYSSTFGVNLDEAAIPDLKHYRSLAEFFARSLREDARIIDEKCCLVSPCDGKVLHFGSASDSNIEQVKGVSYSLESFLGPKWGSDESSQYIECMKHKKNSDTALYQCIIYLAPGDYHRFHSPTSWKPEIRRHFHGELLSVSPKIAKWVPGLFCLNERALYIGKWEHGFFSFTAVGATNVGSVQIYVDEQLKTNKWLGLKVGTLKENSYDEVKLPDDVVLKKGELVGQFNMGSTIVLIFEAPSNFKFNLAPGQQVRVGESLGCFIDVK